MKNKEDSPHSHSVLFVCIGNSFRSQLAEAVAISITDDTWEIRSAGSKPCGYVHPDAITLASEIGLDLNSHYSKGLPEPDTAWDYIVTMGCGDSCPHISGATRLDWDLPDPAGLPLEQGRQIRDKIVGLVTRLINNS